MTLAELFNKAKTDKHVFISGDEVRACSDCDGSHPFLLRGIPIWQCDFASGWAYDFMRDRYRWCFHRMRTVGREYVWFNS